MNESKASNCPKEELRKQGDALREFIFFGGNEDSKDTDQSVLQSQGSAALWHQLLENRFAYLADEVGMGKTRQAMAVIALQFLKKPNSRVVVLCPGETLQIQWQKEWETFLKDCYQGLDGVLKSQLGEQLHWMKMKLYNRLEEFAKHLLVDEHRLHLLRYSSFSRPIGFNKKNDYDEVLDAYMDALRPIGINDLNGEEEQLFEGYESKSLSANSEDRQRLTRELNELYAKRLEFLTREDARAIDLIVCDEAQYLRHTDNARNTNLNNALGRDEKRWLFLSATPLHNGNHDIKCLDLYLCPHDLGPDSQCKSHQCGQISKRFEKKDDVVDILKDFLVRRPRKYLDAQSKPYDKLLYRNYADQATDARSDALSSMITSLVQKKLVESLQGKNNKFRQGECSSFESLASSVKSKFIDGDGVEREASETETLNNQQTEETPDRSAINDLNDSLRQKLIAKGLLREDAAEQISMPHPKLHETAQKVGEACFKDAPIHKVLIFARRLDTVDELIFQLQKQFQYYLDQRIQSWINHLPKLGSNITTANDFWMSKHQVIEEDEVDDENSEQDGDEFELSELGKEVLLPYFSAFKRGRSKEEKGLLYNFFTRLLSNKTTSKNLLPLFLPEDSSSKGHVHDADWKAFINVIFPDRDQVKALPWLIDESHAEKVLNLKRCILQSLRRSDFIVDLYILHNYYHSSDYTTLSKKFIAFLKGDLITKDVIKGEHFETYLENWRRRINKWIMHFELISAKCFVSDDDQQLLVDQEFTRMGPIVGRSGRMKNKHAVSQFKMPCYPNVLVCTDVLKEGVDMHLFCDEIMHYGVAWTSGDIEQRIGRLDRVGSLYNRRINKYESSDTLAPKLTSGFPYLAGTLDEYQVKRVLRKKRISDLQMDFGKKEEEVKDLTVNDLWGEEVETSLKLQAREFIPASIQYQSENSIDSLNPKDLLKLKLEVFSTDSQVREPKLHSCQKLVNTQLEIDSLSEELNCLGLSASGKQIKVGIPLQVQLSDLSVEGIQKQLKSGVMTPIRESSLLSDFHFDTRFKTLVKVYKDLTAPYKQTKVRKQVVLANKVGDDLLLLKSPMKEFDETHEHQWIQRYNKDNHDYFAYEKNNTLWLSYLIYKPEMLGDDFIEVVKDLSIKADAYQQLHYQEDDAEWGDITQSSSGLISYNGSVNMNTDFLEGLIKAVKSAEKPLHITRKDFLSLIGRQRCTIDLVIEMQNLLSEFGVKLLECGNDFICIANGDWHDADLDSIRNEKSEEIEVLRIGDE